MEQDIRDYYDSVAPGAVQVIGADLWNGTTSNVQNFANTTGASYPLLLNGNATAGGNLTALYGPYHNYIVIDGNGILRYRASDTHPFGQRYVLAEIRAVVDDHLPTPVEDRTWSAIKSRFRDP